MNQTVQVRWDFTRFARRQALGPSGVSATQGVAVVPGVLKGLRSYRECPKVLVDWYLSTEVIFVK